MKAFEYASPSTLDLALKALAAPSSEALSGGTDLLCRMKDDVAAPERVVYLKDVKDLAGVKGSAAEGVTIGAGTLLASVVASEAVKASYPALWQTTLEVGTPQIRNMATVGGNLLQRPRCWYFRNGFGLLAMQDGKSLVRLGDNRYHSIFMTDGDALFTSPSSLAVPLIALGATATIVGPNGERTLPVEDLYRAPRTDKQRELTIEPGEILTKVTIPPAKGKNASYEIRAKQSHDWPIVLASVNLTLEGETVSAAKIMLYGVAPIPWRSAAAEQALIGKKLSVETAEDAGKAAVKNAQPLSMNQFKVSLTTTAVKRALLTAGGMKYWEA
ncbi:MAG: FAD binding domain-containing protein [Planctomycetota bacterium]|nr:FAD binding domain-containing protein [Planctomycetota bacterium]